MQSSARLTAWFAALFLCCIATMPGGATAEDIAGTSVPVAASNSAAARDALYAELAADTAELEQRGNILKRVVKLVTPAVVHIEAKRGPRKRHESR